MRGTRHGQERSKGKRNGAGWAAMGEGGEVAGSIVAMQKQSNTNWSHSRGTAGAHRELPTGWSENQRGCKLTGEMSEDERHRKGFGWDSDVENRMKKKTGKRRKRSLERRQLLVSSPLIPAIMANRCTSISNYSKEPLLHYSH